MAMRHEASLHASFRHTSNGDQVVNFLSTASVRILSQDTSVASRLDLEAPACLI